jgi:hypothetical protein
MGKRVVPLVTAMVIAVASLLANAVPVGAWSYSCAVTPGGSKFSGMGIGETLPLWAQGTRADILYAPTGLCVQPPTKTGSASGSWVSIDNPSSSQIAGDDIFQGGIWHCGWGCSDQTRNGQPAFWFYDYGHTAGRCGGAANTGQVYLQNASSGIHTFTIQKNSSTGNYEFIVDTSVKDTEPTSNIETCWQTLPQRHELQNETWDLNDQNSGSVSTHQSWSTNQVEYSLSWHTISWSYPRTCDANSNPTYWQCNVASNHNSIYQYDTRAP